MATTPAGRGMTREEMAMVIILWSGCWIGAGVVCVLTIALKRKACAWVSDLVTQMLDGMAVDLE